MMQVHFIYSVCSDKQTNVKRKLMSLPKVKVVYCNNIIMYKYNELNHVYKIIGAILRKYGWRS